MKLSTTICLANKAMQCYGPLPPLPISSFWWTLYSSIIWDNILHLKLRSLICFSPRAGPFSYFYLFHLFPNTNLSSLIIFNTSKFIHRLLSPSRNITMYLLLTIAHVLRGIHQYIFFINKPTQFYLSILGTGLSHWIFLTILVASLMFIYLFLFVSGPKIEKVVDLSNLSKTFAFQFGCIINF